MVHSNATIFLSPFTLKKLHKGEFVELFYFTNQGLKEAKKAGFKDESFILIQEGDSQSWVPTMSTCNGKNVLTKDKDLTWEEFLEAAPCMINFMQISDWPDDHIKMFIKLWQNLQKHARRFSNDHFSKHSLLVYQGQQRKR